MLSRSFRGMLVILVLSVATIPAIILSVIAIEQLAEQVETRSLNELSLKAGNGSRQVGFELTRVSDRMAALSADSDVRRGVKSAFYLEKTDGRLNELIRANPAVEGAFLFDAEGMMVSGIPEIYMADSFAAQLRAIPSPLRPGSSFSELTATAWVHPVQGVAGFSTAVTNCVFILLPIEGMVNVASGYLMAMIPVNRLTRLIGTGPGESAEVVSGKVGEETPDADLSKNSDERLHAISAVNFAFSDINNLSVDFGDARKKLLAPVEETAGRLSLYAGLLILLLGGLAFMLTRRLLSPLRRLQSQTENYARGNYDFQRPQFKFREMEEFSLLLADMARQVKDRVDLQQAVFRTELDVLRNQMNPHFLFNILNTISTYMTVDAAKATEMSEQLASLYRQILGATKHSTVSLKTECDIVSSYLKLESVRFGKRLQWEMNVAVDQTQFEVPGLLLQTIAENAIKHGISKALAGGKIQIAMNPEADGGCRINIVNTGAAFVEKQGDGIGVDNSRRRLDLLFGDYHQFSIGTRVDGATQVSFLVPPVRTSRHLSPKLDCT